MKKIFGLLAVVLAVGALAFKTPTKHIATTANPVYFQFNGVSGQEDDESKWDEISSTDYSLLGCGATHDGCKIIGSDNQVTGTAPNRHPLTVDVTANGMTRKDPVLGDGITEVSNLDNN